jgi:hypothetical protein
MDTKEINLIKQQIRNLQDLISHAAPDNPNIKGWQQEIANLKALISK